MLYHAFGATVTAKVNGKETKVYKSSIIPKHLKESGMELFKLIFDNNSKDLVKKFFNDSLIRRIWPHILKYLIPDLCFPNGDANMEIEMTFREMTRLILEEFKLEMPEWWLKMFPKLDKPLLQLAAEMAKNGGAGVTRVA